MGLLGILRKTAVAQVRETAVSRCFAGCLVQACNHCSKRCCGLRNNTSDVRPMDEAGVKPPCQTLAPVFRGCPVQARAGVCASAVGENREILRSM